MHDRRLRHRGDLVLAVADALIGRLAAVAGGDQVRLAGRVDAGRLQRRHGEVEIDLVEGQDVAELVAEALQQRADQRRACAAAPRRRARCPRRGACSRVHSLIAFSMPSLFMTTIGYCRSLITSAPAVPFEWTTAYSPAV